MLHPEVNWFEFVQYMQIMEEQAEALPGKAIQAQIHM